MTENAALFFSYNELQNLLRKAIDKPLSQELSLGELGIAAAGAGAITSFFLYVSLDWAPSVNLTKLSTGRRSSW